MILRLEKDYPFSETQALEKIRAAIPEFTEEEFHAMVDDNKIDWIYVHGEPHYFLRFYQTLIKTDAAFAARAGVVNRGRVDGEDNGQTRESLLDRSARLMREKEAVDARIAELQAIRAGIETREGEIAAAAARPVGKFSIKTLPERGLLRMAGEAHEDAEIDFLVKKLHKRYEDELFLIRNGATGALIPLSGIKAGIFNRYSSVFMLREGGEPCDVKVPAGEFATVCFRGAYQNTARFMPKLLAYAKAHSRVPCGNALELYLIDIHESGDPSEYITELQLPVSEAPDAAVPSRRPDSTKP